MDDYRFSQIISEVTRTFVARRRTSAAKKRFERGRYFTHIQRSNSFNVCFSFFFSHVFGMLFSIVYVISGLTFQTQVATLHLVFRTVTNTRKH